MTSMKTSDRISAQCSAYFAFCRLIKPFTKQFVKAHRDLKRDGDFEVLHRLRVGLRRFRCLLWAFEPVLPKRKARAWRRRYAEYAAIAAEARVWNVLIENTLPQAPVKPGAELTSFIEQLQGIAEHKNQSSRKQLLRLRVDRLMGACLSDEQLFRQKRWRNAEQSIKKLARTRLRLAAKGLAKAIQQMNENDVNSIHRVRVEIKRLRYLTELFAPVLKRRDTCLLKLLVDLQSELGAFNDLVDAQRVLSELLKVDTTTCVQKELKFWLDEAVAVRIQLLCLKIRNEI